MGPGDAVRHAFDARTRRSRSQEREWRLDVAHVLTYINSTLCPPQGSKGWFNYRHQADVAHAFQLLKRGGIPQEHIVVMMYDDVAHSPFNPYPGQLFNRPGGKDVYEGITIDYRGKDVNASNFLAVLRGNETAMKGIGSGRVLDSGPHDHVFVYYADHGGPGILGMPEPPYLYADDLNAALEDKHKAGGFKKLVIYVEACESGSIFQGFLRSKSNVYAVTAANSVESSWGTYCPGMGKPDPRGLNVCLGDLFSVSWMENSDSSNLAQETLQEQYIRVLFRTSKNLTYRLGSHTMQFGTFCWIDRPCSDFMGNHTLNFTENRGFDDGKQVPQRDANLMPLIYAYKTAPLGSLERQEAYESLSSVYRAREALDKSVYRVAQIVHSQITSTSQAKPDLDFTVLNTEGFDDVSRPIVEDWDCLRDLIATWESMLGFLGEYGMQHSKVFAKLCNIGVDKPTLQSAILQHQLEAMHKDATVWERHVHTSISW